jgi:hypothetical protein
VHVVNSKLDGKIDRGGSASDARYENGSAPAAVAKCLIALGKQKRIQPFDGKPGKMTCDWAGSLTPGTQMMNTSYAFVR